MSQTRRLLSFFNVVAGGTATIQLPKGDTYERIVLRLAGTTFTKSHLKAIRLRINSKVVHECSGAELDKMNAYTGMFSDSKFLALDFSELKARDQVGQSVGAIGTIAGVDQVTLEVDIDAAAVAPSLSAFAMVSGPKKLDVINKMLRYPANLGAGKSPVQLPYGPQGSLIKRVYVFSNNITSLEVKKNGVTIHDSDKDINEFWQKENGNSPQAGLWVFDPIADKNLGDVVNTADAQTFEFLVTLSAAEAITVFVEYIDRLENN
ncbi:major capsid protein P2 [Chitinibacteraceae bacterium HSL-7]